MTDGPALARAWGQERLLRLKDPGFETLCAHHGEDPARYEGAAVPPIYQSSLFVTPSVEHPPAELPGQPRYHYTRVANPTTDILEAKLAAIERTEAARCFGSGMAAIGGAVMHCVRAGDHVVAVDSVYGPTRAYLSAYLRRYDVSVTYVPGTDPAQFADAARPNTRLFYLESPSTFVFLLQDLAAVAEIARDRGIVTAIDNSWASPYFQNPADFGIDLVIHSATKYLGGHSDIVAGAVMGKREHLQGIHDQEGSLLGGILDPFGAWLILRGLRTLGLRMERHQANALAVAQLLEEHPRVSRVNYPGLPSFPQYDLAKRQMRGCSGLMSFEFKDGSREQAYRFVDRLRYFGIGPSWGGYESLAVPASFAVRREGEAGEFGDKPGTREPGRWGARLHVGLETVDDLLEDIQDALR